MNIYEHCPTVSDECFLLRPVTEQDCDDLLRVYSDTAAVPLFNSDNCHGDDFHYTTPERMLEAIRFWSWSYDNGWFVRWSVVDKVSDTAVGTVEMCLQGDWGSADSRIILRLDLRSDYEREAGITRLLALMLPDAFDWFGTERVITKAKPIAVERIRALTAAGFRPMPEPMTVSDGTQYGDYFILTKQ